MPGGEREQAGDLLGVHRVLDPQVKLPQAADRLDNQLPIFSTEVLIDVERLNIDAASFVQMEEQTKGDAKAIGQIVLDNCRARGKQQNRVTGSGGMLVGRVAQIGSKYTGPIKLKVGDSIASLVSLTLTPLNLDSVEKVNLKNHQLEVRGKAVLFSSSILAHLPKDIDEAVAMAVYDVAGAPATVFSICAARKTLVVLGGGGKAGILSCVAGRRKVGKQGRVIAIEPFEKAAAQLEALGVCDEVLRVDATDPIAVQASVERATRGKLADIVVNVASVAGTEIGSILSVKDRGKVLFFGMATSFSRVALGAEGVGKNAQLLVGNGYFPGHSKFALDCLRKNKKLRELFYLRYRG